MTINFMLQKKETEYHCNYTTELYRHLSEDNKTLNLSLTSSIVKGILTCLIFQEIDLASSSGDWLHHNERFVLFLLFSFSSCHNQFQHSSDMIEAKLTDSEVIHV